MGKLNGSYLKLTICYNNLGKSRRQRGERTFIERDVYFDNAKFLLICLVVIGHGMEPYFFSNQMLQPIYSLIYFFHMPVFVFISGYFSKRVKKPQRYLQQMVYPYLIFQVLYTVFVGYLNNQVFSINLFIPFKMLWFLVSLMAWNLLLIGFTRIKYAVLISVIVGILVGYIQDIGAYISLSRIFVFFPFFLLGYYANRAWITKIKQVPNVIYFVYLSLFFFFIIYHPISFAWFYESSSYPLMNHAEWYAGLYRMGMYGGSLITGMAFLAFVPEKKRFYTTLGERTMYPFLLHIFFVYLVYVNWGNLIAKDSVVMLIYLVGLFLLTCLLSTNITKKCVSFIFQFQF
ncbi:acyltransferase (plasmid) [Aneurinibacillus sp. Ricciae_BoGa-3]|uniref:acyltransferase family protein n=1 Tax=Aneurinibacillus sp. Ricciae_BoGa-3 TaxID=3022697 RepID=UPI0023409059|nr:acyltransferase family protein [Aneurinibacillus sp. Ricciae_BoGa-3]WCK57205.1 acyltransferase [Aneurinibacillus sp. Ricciae_BoGa-3]